MNKLPNILWICADQLRFDTLSVNGDPIVSTPNIKRLADMGANMKNAYSQSPVCAPSRAGFLTGRYPRTTLLRQNGQDIPESERLVTRILKDNGYTCGLSGKLHLSACSFSVCGDTERRIDDGYDVFNWSHHPVSPGETPNWTGNEYTWFLRENGITQGPVKRADCKYVENGYPEEYSQTTWCTNKAIEFMDAAASQDKPFCFTVNYFDPHHPFDPPKEILEKYIKQLDEIPLPNYSPGELDTKSIFANKDHGGAYETPGNYPFSEMNDHDHKMLRAAYYAMIEGIDNNVKRLLDYLEEHQLLENTIILFHSDHGEMLGDHGVYLKGPYFYECCVHVPMLIAWKGHIKEQKTYHNLVEQTDIVPTLLELCGLETEPQIQGRSFARLLTGSSGDDHRDYVYSEFYNSNLNHCEPKAYGTMIFDGRYKLIRFHYQNPCAGLLAGELYDLKTDPTETVNQYANPDYTEVKLRLLESMTDAMTATIDPLPLRRSPW